MRRFWTLVSVLLAAASAGAATGRSADGDCSRALPEGPVGLPGAVVVTTNCGRFRLEPDGHAVYAGAWTSPVPAVARGYWPGDLTWYGRSDGHLLIGRAMEQLWRSHDTYPGPRKGDVGAMALGDGELAFSFFRGRRSSLYLARFGGPERLVAHGEIPIAFTSSTALVTWREHGHALVLRTADGRLARRLAARAADPHVDRETRTVFFRSAGRLYDFDGIRVRKLASLRKLGVTGIPIVEPLGRLVAVHDQRRLVALDYQGRLVASTTLPRRPKRADWVSSSVVANAEGSAVAFTATSGNTASGSSGRETVYLLAAGERQARPLFTEELTFKVCERMASLAWQGRWLLYSSTEQRAAVVDGLGEARPVDLSNAIAQLPGISQDEDAIFDIAWA